MPGGAEKGVAEQEERRDHPGFTGGDHVDLIAAIAVEILRLQFGSGEVLACGVGAIEGQNDFAGWGEQVIGLPCGLIPGGRDREIRNIPKLGIELIKGFVKQKNPQRTCKHKPTHP